MVAPHFSLVDPFVFNYLELPCAVAKADVARIPLFGRVATALQTIFVDRFDPDSKRKCPRLTHVQLPWPGTRARVSL